MNRRTIIILAPQWGHRYKAEVCRTRFVATTGAAPSSWNASEHLRAPSVGQEAEVADANETAGQHMQKEAAQKLGGRVIIFCLEPWV